MSMSRPPATTNPCRRLLHQRPSWPGRPSLRLVLLPGPAPTSTLRANVQSGACLMAVTHRQFAERCRSGRPSHTRRCPVARKVRDACELERLSHVIDDLGVGQAVGLEELTQSGHGDELLLWAGKGRKAGAKPWAEES